MNKLTKTISQSLYIFSKTPTQPFNYLPLYQSKHFKTTQFDDIFLTKGQLAQRYKMLLPNLIFSNFKIFSQKYLFTHLAFDPNNQFLKIVTLRAGGFITQQISINHLIPWSFQDLMAQSKIPIPKLPIFIDQFMIYHNIMTKQTIFCQADGEWTQVVNHPKLSLLSRINEKQWFDRAPIF